jgi:hypothetical protein
MTESFHQGDVLISSAASLILRIASRFEVEDFVKQIRGLLDNSLVAERFHRIEARREICGDEGGD